MWDTLTGGTRANKEVILTETQSHLHMVGADNFLMAFVTKEDSTVNRLASSRALVLIFAIVSVSMGIAGEEGTQCAVYGSGTATYIPMWTNTCDLGNSIIYQSSAKIGIGTTSPQYKLDVNGNFHAASVYTGDATVTGTATGQYLRVQTNVGVGPVPNPSVRVEISGNCKATRFIETSDARTKRNVTTLDGALEKVLKLRGVTYEMSAPGDGQEFAGREIGLVAQEVERVLPELVHTDPEGHKAIAYTRLVPILIRALQEQQQELNDLMRAVDDRQ